MNLKNASILVVDDDPDVLTAVRLLLKTEVKEVITEKNPENLRWHSGHCTPKHSDVISNRYHHMPGDYFTRCRSRRFRT